MKRIYFQAAVASILQYGCTTWTLTKRMEKKASRQLHNNAARNIEQVLAAAPHNAAAVRSLTTHHENIQVRRTWHVGHYWRSRDELISDVLLWTPHMDEQRQDVHLVPTYNISMPIQDVALKSYRKRWTIEKGGGRGSGRSVMMAWHDDDVN